MTSAIASRFRGVLLGGFVGDALGLPFEGTPVSGLQRLEVLVDRRATAPGPLRFSDDTDMAMGVAESLVRRRAVDPRDVLETLVANYDPARGYGKGMKLIVRAVQHGEPWESLASTAWADGSRGNGGAVRVGPIACLLHDDDPAIDDAIKAVTSTTHASAIAIQGAVLLAQAIAMLVRVRSPGELDRERFLNALVDRLPPGEEVFRAKLERVRAFLFGVSCPRSVIAGAIGHGVEAHESVPLALFAFLDAPSEFGSAVLNGIKLGGDTDSIAAMTGSLAGALFGDVGIPSAWLAALENRKRGRDHAIGLANELFALWSALRSDRELGEARDRPRRAQRQP